MRRVRRRRRRVFEPKTKKKTIVNLSFFSVPPLRRLPDVAHEEGNTIINWNLLTKNEQAKEGVLHSVGKYSGARWQDNRH